MAGLIADIGGWAIGSMVAVAVGFAVYSVTFSLTDGILTGTKSWVQSR